MGLSTTLADAVREVDVIIVGGGTAGCIVAGRLAGADPSLSILVIEQGQDNYNVPTITNPALFLSHLAPTSTTAIFYKGNKAAQLGDREAIVPSGGTLGGGSSINFMMYTRAQRSDFDSWNTPGWSADEVLPYLKKLETYHGEDPDNIHGRDGPIHVSDGTLRSVNPESDFIKAAGEIGWPEIPDLQNLKSINGFQRWKRYVSPDGKRQDTAHRYLHPVLRDGQHPSLHVLVESSVVRILFDENKKAIGVECIPTPTFQPATGLAKQPKQTIKARKLVVVSSGACGTPPILERSGLGDPKILERAGVPVVVDLPGVGRDYQDHNLVLYPYRTNLRPDETLDGILSGRSDAAQMMQENHKLLGWNGIDISAKLRPTDSEIAELGTEFQAAWDKDFKHVPDRPLMLMGLVSCFLGDPTTVPPGQYVTTGNYTGYPYSRGHMHITGPEYGDPLDFDVGFLTDQYDIDLKKQVWAYKKQREIMRRTKMYRGELSLGHPAFLPNSPAACIETEAALSGVKDIAYSADDDKAIEKWIRENLNTTWHSIGTAKMAPKEDFGVVDGSLNVYGTKGLKIADLSIPPENVGANTNNTALVVGEKAADIIIKELGLDIRAAKM
ncbi:alcohol oxidase-like protein [Dactylonectria estremocensis]|uniref:Alcohol oxidase-like protein n=1 Tax=Dactylonectria estremocensis TaxID=1079267 RepID=A0A9P9J827_9HYPO|nr:alcohol oxidase-like protein [Dactylonectria estremocensis]